MDIDKNGSINTKDSKKLEENNASRILDEFPPWKEFTDRKIKLFRYFRTRKAICSGEPVWEYSKDELEKNKFLPPW